MCTFSKLESTTAKTSAEFSHIQFCFLQFIPNYKTKMKLRRKQKIMFILHLKNQNLLLCIEGKILLTFYVIKYESFALSCIT